MSLFETSPRLALPLIIASQAQKHLTHNEALVLLETLVQPVVQDMAALTPPAAPEPADCVVVGGGATDGFAGEDGKIAAFIADAWHFFTPKAGWSVVLADNGQPFVFGSSGWSELPTPSEQQNLDQVGINATASATNRLTVTSDATLLNAENDDHRLTINKAGPTATGSLLFQSGWSGRAEMGLAGADGFSIKVSADGSAWQQALSIDPATGHVALPARAAAKAYIDGGVRSFSAGDVIGFDGLAQGQGGMAPGAALTAPATGSGLAIAHDGLYQISTTLKATALGGFSLLANGTPIATFDADLSSVGGRSVTYSCVQALSAGDELTLRLDDAATLDCSNTTTWIDCCAL
ncbi:MAG: DUF2793 domain-containing protein [Pseudomonadota bacterium]